MFMDFPNIYSIFEFTGGLEAVFMADFEAFWSGLGTIGIDDWP